MSVSIRRCPAPLLAKPSPNSWSDVKVGQDRHVETNVQIGVDGSVVKAATVVVLHVFQHHTSVVWLPPNEPVLEILLAASVAKTELQNALH